MGNCCAAEEGIARHEGPLNLKKGTQKEEKNTAEGIGEKKSQLMKTKTEK